MALDALKTQGYADYSDLKPYIKNTINKGKNEFGFNEKVIICDDGSNWDYIPEDGLYEYNPNSHVTVN